MKRKLLILAAALVIAVSAVGCGKDEDKTDAEGSQQKMCIRDSNSSMPGVVTGYTAATKIDNIANQTFNSLGTACATYAGQNYGAKKFDRIKDGVFASMVYCCLLYTSNKERE